jgi:outer membrane biosynthesis protein TonB
MANGGGGSRIGGFFRGVLTGLVVCAIVLVALSLSAPVPERAVPGGDAEAPGAATQAEPAATAEPEAAVPETAAVPAPESAAEPAAGPAAEPAPAAPETGASPDAAVIVEPDQEPAAQAEPAPPAAEDSVAPQPTWQTSPGTGEADTPVRDSDAFSAPQNASE